MKKKVGILGGTFDPVHMAHLILAENAWQQFKLDTVLIMPDGDPPHKSERAVTAARHRVRMLQLAIDDNRHFKLSTVEVERTGKTYTAETLTDLCRYNPDCEYYFIIGADSLFQIENWYHPELIMQHATLLAAVREDLEPPQLEQKMEQLRAQYQARIHLLHTPNMSLSSSSIRERVAEGQSIKYLVPKDVEKYIYQNKLYQSADTASAGKKAAQGSTPPKKS